MVVRYKKSTQLKQRKVILIMSKKEIILVQNQSTSLRVFLKHLKREKFLVRIASNLANLIELAKEKAPDILIISAKMIPSEIQSFLSYLRGIIPNGKLIVTHVENHEISAEIMNFFPSAETFRSQIIFALPKELTELLKEEKGFRVTRFLRRGVFA